VTGRHVKPSAALLCWALCLPALVGAAQADTLLGRVVAVADGDTLTVLDASNTQHRIRLAGIDAPEKGQPFGDASKRSLSDLGYDRHVSVHWNKQDRYGRMVGKVIVDGRDVNLEQVRRGLAWWFRRYADEQSPLDRATYESAEVEARNAKRGLWGDRNPVAPWDWRKTR
jgi:endonuclease YncB( thermonuclease family)